MNRLVFSLRSPLILPSIRIFPLLTSVRQLSRENISRSQSDGIFSKIPSRSLWFSKQVFKYGCILYVVNAYIVDLFVCIGPSMEPTIQSHDVVLTEHLTQRFGVLRRGDLVVARSPTSPNTFICKRIVAKAGDLVHDENQSIVKVPRGHVWLEGDNQDDSVDSRRYGAVPEALIRSKLCARLWPLARFGRINDFKRAAQPGEDIEDPQSYNFN